MSSALSVQPDRPIPTSILLVAAVFIHYTLSALLSMPDVILARPLSGPVNWMGIVDLGRPALTGLVAWRLFRLQRGWHWIAVALLMIHALGDVYGSYLMYRDIALPAELRPRILASTIASSAGSVSIDLWATSLLVRPASRRLFGTQSGGGTANGS